MKENNKNMFFGIPISLNEMIFKGTVKEFFSTTAAKAGYCCMDLLSESEPTKESLYCKLNDIYCKNAPICKVKEKKERL